jgi:hypothetical protein
MADLVVPFSIGATVVNRRIGPPLVGTVVGYVTSGHHFECLLKGSYVGLAIPIDLSEWDERHPRWRCGAVAVLTRSLTTKEAETAREQGLGDEVRAVVFAPVSDLEEL